MLPGHLQPTLEHVLGKSLGVDTQIIKSKSVGGGCIHHATQLLTERGSWFLKYNQLAELANFQAEARGLEVLGQSGTLRVPKVIAVNQTETHAFILMEYLIPEGRPKGFWTDFGCSLAKMHQHTAEKYGLDHDNFIGRLPQSNQQHTSWIDFFIQQRLEPQLQLAEEKQLALSDLRPAFEALYPRLVNLIPEEPASLLHGDLWSGNFLCGPNGQPCLFDPAVYYGHREAEIAFTQLFGGFNSEFYTAYQQTWPLQKGWENRVPLFNLYPLMVHLNLFGRGYLPDIQAILTKFA